jgi:hypothetical protein
VEAAKKSHGFELSAEERVPFSVLVSRKFR